MLACSGLLLLRQGTPLPSEQAAPIRLEGRAGPIGSTGIRDLTGEGYAFLEVEAARDAYYVEEQVRLTIRVGLSAEFVDEHLVQLFARPLDLPVQLDISGLADLPGTRQIRAATPVASAGVSLALNEEVARVGALDVVLHDGEPFRVVTLERVLCPTLPGALRIPECSLRFAYASGFSDDVFHGRVPTDRIDARVHSRAFELEVLAWPESNRPADFGGAVGDFTLRATADPRDLVLGQSLRFTVVFEGQGNLDRFEAPHLEGWRGFDPLGRLDEFADGRRTIAYDLAPTSQDVVEVPALAFTTFDPGPPATYRKLRTPSIPILVRPPPRAARPAAELGLGDSSDPPSFSRVLLWSGAVGILLLAGLVLARRRMGA